MTQYDPFDLDSQQARLDQLEQADDLRRAIEEQDFKWLMDDARGRRIVWNLLDIAGVFRSSYTGDNATFFREGQRNLGLIVLAKLNEYCPGAYSNMVEENGRRSNRTDKRTDDVGGSSTTG